MRDRPTLVGAGARALVAIVVAVVTGAVVAVLALPPFVGAGLAARSGIDAFQSLPTDFAVPTLEQRNVILAADGSTLADLYTQNRVVVALADVPPVMRNALISVEDARFYEHHGIDVVGLVRAVATNARSGGVTQGGSTLTQQFVKNALIESAGTPAARAAAQADTLSRKVQEARYALALEQKWTKDQILEAYLNIAYFGDGAYGVGTAAEHYFGVPVSKLSLAQAAMLAGLVRNPSAYDPALHPAAGTARRSYVLDRMVANTALTGVTQAQADAAKAQPLDLHLSTPPNGCVTSFAPFFCDYLVNDVLLNDPALGSTVAERRDRLAQGGLTIKTTIDPARQKAAQNTVDTYVPRDERYGAVVDSVEPGTGYIRSMAVNRTYGTGPGQTQVNLATGGKSGLFGGSTYKMFVLAALVQAGVSLDYTENCPYAYTSNVYRDNGQPHTFHNANGGEGGSFNVVQATWESVNTCFVQYEEKIGMESIASLAESMGLFRIANGTKGALQRVGTFTLGQQESSPLALAGAYATIASHGTFCPPTAITAIVTAQGRLLGDHTPQCHRVLDTQAADTVASILKGVIDGPDPNRTGVYASIGRPAAGKTGTNDKHQGALFAGFVPQLAAVVWVGDATYPTQVPLERVTIGGKFYSYVDGYHLPAPMWHSYMSQALQGVPVAAINGPDVTGIGQRPQTRPVPNVVGLTPAQAAVALQAAGFSSTVSATPVQTGGVAGTVGAQSPAAGANAAVGSTVSMSLTDGTLPAPSAAPPPAPGAPGAPPTAPAVPAPSRIPLTPPAPAAGPPTPPKP